MLPSRKRVTTERFKEAFKKGRVYTTPLFSVRMYEDPTLPSPLFSFVVPKSVHKKAVQRNLLRKRAYSAVQKHIGALKGKSFILIGVFKKEAKYASFEAIEVSLSSFLREKRIIL